MHQKKTALLNVNLIVPKKIDGETQENIFMAFYKLDTNGKHSFRAQTTVYSSVAGTKEGRKKSNYSYFLMKGEGSFPVKCKSQPLRFHKRWSTMFIKKKKKTY